MEIVNDHKDSRQVQRVLNQVVRQFDNTGSFSLANTATSTTVTDRKISAVSKVILQPTSAAAVTANAYVSAVNNGSFVVTHASATTVRTFAYVVFGA